MVKIYHDEIMDRLKELSDKPFQERVSAQNAEPEMSSFEEAVCQLYGGTGLGTAYNKGLSVYGDEIDGLLKDLRAKLQGIPINRPPRELVKDEKMIPVRKMAADILSKIQQKGTEGLAQNIKA